jgi:hypothetical protein
VRDLASRLDAGPQWMDRLRFGPAPAHNSVSGAWNAVFQAWQQTR